MTEKSEKTKKKPVASPKVFTKQLDDGVSTSGSALPISPISAPIPNRAGGLQSAITITLQTRAASRAWHGRGNIADRPSLMGVNKFAALARNISEASAIDDPFADWWLVKLQSGLQQARERMTKFTDTIETFLSDSLPEGLSVGDCLSVSAEKIEVRFATPYGFMAAYVVADFDKAARHILLARHIALLDMVNSERMLTEGNRIVRGALELVQGYRFTGVTREDVAANNPKSARAFEMMGRCPDEILRGDKRSDFAPFNAKLHESQRRVGGASVDKVEALASEITSINSDDTLPADSNDLADLQVN